mgnify:CR=1 FL=1
MTATENNSMKQTSTPIKKPETTAQLIKRLVIAYYAKKGISLCELNKFDTINSQDPEIG